MRGASSSKRRTPREGTAPGLISRPDLPFDIPTRKVLLAGKRVFAHYFLTFPIAYTYSQDSPTAPDVDTRYETDNVTPKSKANAYWRRNPGGNDFLSIGGELRDEPLEKRAPRATIDSPTLAGKKLDYRVQDKIIEIRQAMAGGQDGFTVDLLDVPQNADQYDLTVKSKEASGGTSDGAPLRWRQAVELHEGCAEVNRQEGYQAFTIFSMPDCSTGATQNATNLANAIDWLDKNYPGTVYKRGGATVYGPYAAEKAPDGASTGQDVFHETCIGRLVALGHKVYFLPLYQATWTGANQHPKLAHLSQGITRWGERDPALSRAENEHNMRMHAHIIANYPGNEYMAPVSLGDIRPNQSNYYESVHHENLDQTWLSAMGDGTSVHVQAELVQHPTWNDQAEHAHLGPTDNQGWCALDLSLWHLIAYKTGAYPQIDRDAVYLSHRVQPTDDAATMNYTGGQTKFMTKRSGTPNQNTVALILFLTAPANVTLTIGTRSITYTDVPAGRQVRKESLLPFGDGKVGVTLSRNGTLIASISKDKRRRKPGIVSTTQISQDMHYRFWKSLPDPTITLTSNALTG